MVTMSDFSIFRFSDPFFGKSGFSENVVTMSDFWLRFSENRKFFPIEFFDRIFLSDSDFLRCVKGGSLMTEHLRGYYLAKSFGLKRGLNWT